MTPDKQERGRAQSSGAVPCTATGDSSTLVFAPSILAEASWLTLLFCAHTARCEVHFTQEGDEGERDEVQKAGHVQNPTP